MDKQSLVTKLQDLFSNENNKDYQIVRIWIRRVKHPIITRISQFTLNIQVGHPVQDWKVMREILHWLHAKDKEVYNHIDGVNVHYFEDGHYEWRRKDIIVYDAKETAA